MVILADSSVWVRHFHRADVGLDGLLRQKRIRMHPLVIGELACGKLPDRTATLHLLRRLPSAAVVAHEEVLRLVEERRLWGKGISWIDAHLLASALLTPAPLWTLDRKLAAVVARLKIAL